MFYELVSFGFKVVYRLISRHRTEWEEDLKNVVGPAIIAPNHVSFLDPQLISASWPGELHFFAREDLFQKKFFGLILRGLNTHPVAKGKELATIRLAIDLLRSGKKVVLFPEGTRSSDGEIGAIRDGVAFLARHVGCPIIPCFIEGSYTIWPKNQKLPNFFGSQTVCRFGKPIWPKNDAGVVLSSDQLNATLLEELLRLGKSITH